MSPLCSLTNPFLQELSIILICLQYNKCACLNCIVRNGDDTQCDRHHSLVRTSSCASTYNARSNIIKIKRVKIKKNE